MSSEWKPWNGGECPVHPETVVEALASSGKLLHCEAGAMNWEHEAIGYSDTVAYRIIKELEEPKEKTLEERIKEKWADKEVILLDTNAQGSLVILQESGPSSYHIDAISMKGFAGYIYIKGRTGEKLRDSSSPCHKVDGKYQFPVAVIFEKELSE